jgi:hypothetical protein
VEYAQDPRTLRFYDSPRREQIRARKIAAENLETDRPPAATLNYEMAPAKHLSNVFFIVSMPTGRICQLKLFVPREH